MIQYCRMRAVQVIETVRYSGLRELFHETVYLDREAVPVEIDLAELLPMEEFQAVLDEELVEIRAEMISQGKLAYPVRNRLLKARNYLRRGYRGFALVAGGIVSGDIWCATCRGRDGFKHGDEHFLNLDCRGGEVYTFDMYLAPGSGMNGSVALQNGMLHRLRREGFLKAYGYFWTDDIAALRVHRALRWKELERVKLSRFLFSRRFNLHQ